MIHMCHSVTCSNCTWQTWQELQIHSFNRTTVTETNLSLLELLAEASQTWPKREAVAGEPRIFKFLQTVLKSYEIYWNLFGPLTFIDIHIPSFSSFHIHSFQGKSSRKPRTWWKSQQKHNETENATFVVLTLLTQTFQTCLSTNCLRCVQAALWAMQSFGQWLERPRSIWVAQLAPLVPLVQWPFCWSVAFPWCCWRSWDAKPWKQPKNKYNNTDIVRKGMFYTERYVIPTRRTERRERVHGSPGWRVVQIWGEFGMLFELWQVVSLLAIWRAGCGEMVLCCIHTCQRVNNFRFFDLLCWFYCVYINRFQWPGGVCVPLDLKTPRRRVVWGPETRVMISCHQWGIM